MEHRHMVGIRKIFPDPSGTRIIFIDDKSDGYILNPVSNLSGVRIVSQLPEVRLCGECESLKNPTIAVCYEGILGDLMPPLAHV